MNMMCDYCEETLTSDDRYIKYDDERYCSKCYTERIVSYYYVDGEFIETDDDGVEKYDKWNKEVQ